MRSIRFIHVFTVLMILSAVCAFAVPAKTTDKARDNVKLLFYPVARPANWLATLVAPQKQRDDAAPDPNHPRDVREIVRENHELRVQIANLTGRMQKLDELDKVLASVGDVRNLCERFKVIG